MIPMKTVKWFVVAFVLLFAASGVVTPSAAKEGVVVRKTKNGIGATEEQAEQVYQLFLQKLSTYDAIEVRTTSGCEKPCAEARYIVASELRMAESFITIYFYIYDLKRGLAKNTRRLRVKDATFEDLLELINDDFIKNIFVFHDSGNFSSSEVITK